MESMSKRGELLSEIVDIDYIEECFDGNVECYIYDYLADEENKYESYGLCKYDHELTYGSSWEKDYEEFKKYRKDLISKAKLYIKLKKEADLI